MAIGYGLRRVYRMARNVDELVTVIAENNKLAKAASATLATVQTDVGQLKETVSSLRARVDTVQRWQDHEETRREIVKELAHDESISEDVV